MNFLILLIASPFTALVWIVMAALSAYAFWDYASRHWLALAIAIGVWIVTGLIAARLPDPGPDRRTRVGAFALGFALTMIVYVIFSGAMTDWHRTGRWNAAPAIVLSLLGGTAFGFFRRPALTGG